MADALTIVERAKLENHETVIANGLQSFVDVGRALMAIRDERLYRATFSTFEDYCQERWSFTQQYATQLCRSSAVVLRIEQSETTVSAPENERQARPLTRLPKSEQADAWQEAVETSPDGKVTAAHVERIVAGRLPLPEPSIVVDGEAVEVESIAALDGHRFGCIYADPPWAYSNQATRASTDNHYCTMSVDDLCAMPISGLAADDAHLHLWTTNAFLFDAKRVIEAWGFEFRSVFVWVKPQMGIGNYWRVSHEFLLTAVRGDAKRFNDKSLMSWGQFDRGKHSAKPEEVRSMIERASHGPYLELFGRKAVGNWTVYGNQIEQRLFA